MKIIDGKPIFDTPEEQQEYSATESYNFEKINTYIIDRKPLSKEGSNLTIDDAIEELQKIKDNPNLIVKSMICHISLLNLEKMNGGKDE